MTITHTCAGCGKPMAMEASEDCPADALRLFLRCVRCDECVQPLKAPAQPHCDNVVRLHGGAQSSAVASPQRHASKGIFCLAGSLRVTRKANEFL